MVVPPMNATLERLSNWRLVDSFLLKSAERTVSSYPQGRQEKMRQFFRVAGQRMRAAEELGDGDTSVLALYREAALLYMAALVTLSSDEALPEPLRSETIVPRFREHSPSRPPPRPSEEVEDFLDLLLTEDPLALDKVPPEQAAERIQSIRTIVGWLGDLIEPRTIRQIKTQRGVRIGLLGTAVVVLAVWGFNKAFSPKDLALHKPVQASSVHPAATSPPTGLTDGVTSGTYGVHTNREDSPWVQVDLEDVYRIDKVKVYNRGDGWFDDGLPMTLQFSEDGKEFTEVDKRTTNFGQLIPWSYDAHKKKARYVRVAGAKGTYVTLSELEVFGRK